MRINTNIAAIGAQRNLGVTNAQLQRSIERLSSGLRINRAADDAAGLSISEKMRTQIRGLNQAVRNAQDGISLVQTAEGALNEVHDMLKRMDELALQGANGTLSADDRSAIVSELNQLKSEVDRIASVTDFNGTKLLNGAAGSPTAVNLQIGAGTTADESLAVSISGSGSAAIGTVGGGAASLSAAVTTVAGGATETNFKALADSVQQAVKDVSKIRSDIGAYQNRLEHTIANLNVAVENLSASESRIRDADMSAEVVQMTRAQILQQAGMSVLAQANQAPQSVLSLLR